jgi:repressor LexA
MFDKSKFGLILKKINDSYLTQYEFAYYSKVNRTYLSKYINMKLEEPPKPKILEKIANASKGITTYEELMQVCGYTDNNLKNNSNVNHDIAVLPLFVSNNGNLEVFSDLWVSKSLLNPANQYFAYKTNDDSMLPLLGSGDIAIIEKTETYNNGETCLMSLDTNNILIRKIIDLNEYIELQIPIPYSRPITLTKEEMKDRNFKILGKVIRVENSSAFK